MWNVTARAPVRIDLSGGTLDIWPLCLALPQPAVTVNVALDLPTWARVEGSGEEAAIRLESQDQAQTAEFRDLAALRVALERGEAALSLLGEAVSAAAPSGGLTLTTHAGSPAGAGLGGSSALLVCVMAALGCGGDDSDDHRRALQRLAQDVETRVLRTPTGYQDYFPPLFGGCLALEAVPGDVRVERLDVDLEALARRLRLVYTGAPHVSGITNWGTVRAYLDAEPHTVSALHALARISRDVRAALRRGDLDAALAGVLADGRIRLDMAPGVSTKDIEAIHEAAVGAGALGSKVMGAGGGGCLLVVLREGDDGAAVDRVLAAGPGRPIPLVLSPRGLVIQQA